MKKNTKVKVIIVIVVLVLAAAIGAAALFWWNSREKEPLPADPVQAEENYEQIKEKVVTEEPDPYFNDIDFGALQAVNPDAYAWIRIPGTNIDYPVMQSAQKEDDYYLNTTIDGTQGLPGSIYTEKYNAADFSDPVTVMYGHDLVEGTMFSELHKYEDRAFFDGNPYIYVYRPGQTLKYQVYAAVAFDDRYLLGSYNFRDPVDFQKYLDEVRSSIAGNVNMDVPVNQDSKILTLSTCISDSPNQRWLVSAVLMPQE